MYNCKNCAFGCFELFEGKNVKIFCRKLNFNIPLSRLKVLKYCLFFGKVRNDD